MGLHKVQLVLDLAKLGVDALTVDADAFILRDAWQYIRRYPRADVLMSSDLLRATRGYNHTGLEDGSGFGADYNIGYIFIRHTAVEFVQRWRDACFRSPTAWDQQLFASVLRSGSRGGAMTAKNLRPMFRTKEGKSLLAGVLPVALFASGHTFFVTRMAHLMHRVPFMVHTTFQYGGAEGKRHRLREGMMWEDDLDYYSKPDFLTFTPDIPYELVYPRGPSTVRADGSVDRQDWMSVDQHFKLVNHQLAQIRDALALAKSLGRILILPKLICGLDRYWAPHSGIIPGSATRLPLLECPADHVIDLERMHPPEALLREWTMLCNPRVPKAVLASTRDVRFAPTGPVDVPRMKTDLAAVKILVVKGAVPSFTRVLAPPARRQFKDQVRPYASLWCCNRPPGGRGAGHIWYDWLWDVVPHVDRHNRKWTKPWTPIMGP